MAKFKKQDLKDLVDDGCETLEKVEERCTGRSRWSLNYCMVFKDTGSGRFYMANYSVGATEQQDEGPFEYEPDEVECVEMRPVEKVVTVYEAV